MRYSLGGEMEKKILLDYCSINSPRGEMEDAGVLKTPVQMDVLVQLQSGGLKNVL